MRNNFYYARFVSYDSMNYLQLSFDFNAQENEYYNIVISNENDDIFYSSNIENLHWYNFDFFKVFKYNLKFLKFDGDEIKFIHQEIFDPNNHNFNIMLKTDNDKEMKIWKYYLWLLQIKYGYKFNIIENENFENMDDYNDYVEISMEAYKIFLRKQKNAIVNDYSSLTIISKLFDIIEDNSDIINHPWLKEYL